MEVIFGIRLLPSFRNNLGTNKNRRMRVNLPAYWFEQQRSLRHVNHKINRQGDDYMRGAKMIRLSLSAALIAGMVGLTGCGSTTDNTAMHTKSVRNHSAGNYNSMNQGSRLNSYQNNKMSTMKHSATLSNKVAQLPDVQTAHVIVTDHDAYVALTLHNQTGQNTGTGKLGTLSTGMRNNMGTSMGTNRGTTNMGTRNVGGPYGADYGTRGAADNGLSRINGRSGSLMDMGRGAIFGDNNRNGINTGRVTTNGTNQGMNYGTGTYGTGTYGTYGTSTGTGTTLNNSGTVVDNVPQNVKDEISRVVKNADSKIRNVYVSNHPDFMSGVGGYVTKSRGGMMVNEAVVDFEELVQRIFPSRTGTMTGPSGYTPTPTQRNGINGVTR